MAAYGSWLQGNAGKKSFGDYLNSLGLVEKHSKTPRSQNRKLALKGYGVAQKILKMYIRKKKKK